ncbi:MAG: non-canonical purine NTP pyrophosphatase [Opitutaceae bacterium]|nr:non-canonical purine NTP pyrophosphatase [Opitutaceae bacterium]
MSAPAVMRWFLASGNAHKVAELRALAAVSGLPITIHSAREAGGMPPVVEDSGTFRGNAGKKARALLAVLPPGAWALADDSGVCVDALDGAPGVESAYYAGPQSDPAANLAKLVEVMRAVPEAHRGARFLSVLCLAGPGGVEEYFEGRCEGRLCREPRGGEGFGYDPLFIPLGYSATYAELGDEVKSRISHRAKAWRALVDWARRAPPVSMAAPGRRP